ncbi:MAG: penicillin acylase family protein [Candidatus Tectomicrobia bacterium]|uniref:Penicillin acylase family protein n=1 Tax=Tectimicrobiota bacterium TaxID=2528274 RepID=A0A933GK98_UNCTE|nr:penicillin acylase family protein [Candidatus Tectomicrobia bacterium]
MGRLKKLILSIIVALLVLFVIGISSSYYYLFKRVEPQISGNSYIKGITAPVRVLFDPYGIPHVYAENRQDLYFAQGFLHARERLWQMEVNRLLGQGRMAEVVGEKALELDYFYRLLGLMKAARKSFASLDADIQEDLQAYSAGVNEFITTNPGRLPVEFTLTGHRPELWHPSDSILIILTTAWILSQNYEEELLSARLILKLGAEKARQFIAPYEAKVTGENTGDTKEEKIPEELKMAWRHMAPLISGNKELKKLFAYKPQPLASNNWVVSGKKSSSGKPIIANDPHLPITLPSFWYEMHLVSPGMNVIGASGAGVPFIIIGHNEHVAWTYTNAMTDNVDLYLIKVDPEHPERYLYDGKWHLIDKEEIHMKAKGGKHPFRKKAYYTLHGPIVSKMVSIDKSQYLVAMVWSGFDVNADVSAFAKLNRAKGENEIKEAAQDFGVLSQNLLYADSSGHIGWQLTGKIPFRVKGNGKYPVPGWESEYLWSGYLPFNSLPHLENPVEEFLATANNKVVDDSYPHIISNTWVAPYRVLRISQLLSEKKQLSKDDFQSIQGDAYSLSAKELVSQLGDFELENPRYSGALQELRSWDYTLKAESTAALLYELIAWRIRENQLSRALGELKEAYLGSLLALSFPSVEMLKQLKGDNLAEWKNLIERSINEALEALDERLGKAKTNWNWGALHRVDFIHPLGQVKPLNWILNLGSFGLGGDENTIMAGVYSFTNPFKVTVTPSYRIITDLSDFGQAISMNTTGQSGHPFSRHYRDMVRSWLEVKYHPLWFYKEDVEKNAQSRLIFLPSEPK